MRMPPNPVWLVIDCHLWNSCFQKCLVRKWAALGSSEFAIAGGVQVPGWPILRDVTESTSPSERNNCFKGGFGNSGLWVYWESVQFDNSRYWLNLIYSELSILNDDILILFSPLTSVAFKITRNRPIYNILVYLCRLVKSYAGKNPHFNEL